MCSIFCTFAQNFVNCAMNSIPSFNSYIERSIIKNWHLDALTDYKGATLQYHDVARKIEKLHILFENSDVKKGDKIAVCGRNSSQWAVAFLAIITYGAIVVPIQNEFKPEQIHNIVNHSESKLLFVGDVVATQITPDEMPTLEGIIYLPDNSLVISRSEKLTYAREHLNAMFGHKYPKYFRPEHVKYHVDDPEELAMINYTSGTTGFSKGVMLPYRALWGNLDYLMDTVSPKIGKNCNILSTLPMAHMYGLMTEFIYNMAMGNPIFFLTRLPSPTLISEALAEIKPDIIFAVPLVVDKIVRKEVFPHIQTNRARLLMNMPVINKRIKGVSVHTGYAKGKMINASRLAVEFQNMIPEAETPEQTEGYQGFYHLLGIESRCEEAKLSYIIRDHDRQKFEARKDFIEDCVKKMNEKYGEGTVTAEIYDQYYNMKEKIDPNMHVIDIVLRAMQESGVPPRVEPIRGGTDGAQLSFKGLPCPNIFAGGVNFHGPHEFVSVQVMQKVVDTIVKIAEITEEYND